MQGFEPFGQPQREMPLHRRRKRFVLMPLDAEQGFFSGTESTSMDELEGAKTVEEETIHQAGCGHLVGFQSPAELISQCAFCGKWLCFRCGNLRCRKCLKILCESCAKILDETSVYCRRCRRIVRLKRLLGKGAKGLHEFLSKEI